jgi:hypothetical protein
VPSIGSSPGILPSDTRPAKIQNTGAGPSNASGGLVDYGDSDDERERSRSPSPSGSDAEPEEREERTDGIPSIASPASSTEQRRAARAAVDAIQPYSADNWEAARDGIVKDLLALQPFLAPQAHQGGQGMWDENDELLVILPEGFLKMVEHIESNRMLKQMFGKHPGLVDRGGVVLGKSMPDSTFLSFLRGMDQHTCAQATDGEIQQWVDRLTGIEL